MKIKTLTEVKDFLEAVDKCKEPVYLVSQYGDKYNLKSKLTQYIAIAELLKEHGDWLELYCARKEDETFFYQYFQHHPEVV